jgi:hypothetical protein
MKAHLEKRTSLYFFSLATTPCSFCFCCVVCCSRCCWCGPFVFSLVDVYRGFYFNAATHAVLA